MKSGIGMLLVGLAALLFVASACAEPPSAGPAPLPVAQARIEGLVEAIVSADREGSEDEIAKMAEQLQRELNDDRESLLLQLLLFMTSHPGNEPAMGTALLIDFYGFTDEEKVAGLAPYLDAGDPGLRDTMWEVLGTVGDPPGAREAALRVQELERFLASDTGSADAGIDKARREIDALSRDPAWWVRLYVAHVVRGRPELGSGEVVERLRADAEAPVRQAAGG